MMDLHDLGWNDVLERSRQAHAADLVPARVVAEHRNLYRVQTADAELAAHTAGRLRYCAIQPGRVARGRRLGVDHDDSRRPRRSHSRGSASIIVFLAEGGWEPYRGAGGRRQHRFRLHYQRTRSAAQPAANRKVSDSGMGERSHAGHPSDQG